MTRSDFYLRLLQTLTIRTSEQELVPLRLNVPQQRVWKIMAERLNSGKKIWLIILKARREGICLAPDTRVLTEDLRWVPIGKLTVGQKLVACDEHIPGGRGATRVLRQATVVATREIVAPAYRLTMDNGETLVATFEHRFLMRRRGGTEAVWKAVRTMRVGDVIRTITQPWGEPDYEDGWFSGMMDGEGTLRPKSRAGVELTVCQNFGAVYDRAVAYVRDRQYHFREDVDTHKHTNDNFMRKPLGRIVLGRLNEIFRLVGQTRPSRFMQRAPFWEGKAFPGRRVGGQWVKICAIEPLQRPQTMIDLQTSTGTFIAEGFVSHNSTLIESLMVTWTATVDHTRSVITAHEKPATQIIQEIADRMIDYSPLRHGVRKLGTTRYFPFRSSQLSISTAGSPDAQRGNDITCFHGSEVASWPFPAALTATIQCIPTKHQSLCILESTAKGKTNEGQLFYDLWCEAYSDPEHSAWLPLFLPWYELPDYEWPNQQHPESWVYGPDWTPSMNGEVKVFEDLDDEEKELKSRFTLRAGQLAWRRYEGMPKCKARKGSDLFFHQEYPSTPEEAFISSGIPFFLSRDLYWLQPTLCTGKRYRVYPDGRLEACDDGPIELWKLPEHGHEYVIGADSSMGIADDEHSRSAVEIVDMKTMEQVGEVDSQAAPHVLSSWLAGLGRAYNEALIAPEVNASGGGGGRSIIEYLIDRYEYFHLHRWRHPDAVRQDPGRLYGWECLDPEAKVLTADLQWVAARNVKVGDCVIGCQEFPTHGQGSCNRLRMQTLVSRTVFLAQRVRVTLANGQQTCVSANHPFWVCQSGHRAGRWKLAVDLKPSDYVRYLPMWNTVKSYEAGRLSAFIDGEGHLAQGKQYGFQLLVSQTKGPLADEIRDLWRVLGFDAPFKWLRHKKRPQEKPVMVVGVLRLPEVLRALGSLRPTRLLRRFRELVWGRLTIRSLEKVAVAKVESLGEGPVVGLTTEPDHTLIADGIVGHNTNVKTRPRMLAHIREVINEKVCLIHSRELARQLADFGQNAAGKYEATSGYDDLVFAWGIALCSRFENYHPWSPGVKKDPIQWDELGLGRVIQPWELEEARFQASCESVPAGTYVQNRGIWRPRREGPATPDEY